MNNAIMKRRFRSHSIVGSSREEGTLSTRKPFRKEDVNFVAVAKTIMFIELPLRTRPIVVGGVSKGSRKKKRDLQELVSVLARLTE